MKIIRPIWKKTMILFAVACGAIYFAPDFAQHVGYAVAAGKAQAAREDLKGQENGEDSSTTTLSVNFRKVSKAMAPSVVSIYSVKRVQPAPRIQRHPLPGFGHSPFREFFGDDFFDRFFEHRSPDRGFEQRGLGTGVIVSKDGYILTNNHVVDGADEINVKLSTGTSLSAKVVGTDPKSDLAVLRVDDKNLIEAPLGDSEKLQVGDWVLAMGNPFGLSQTVTAGIVSAIGRANVGIADYEDFIQTDAAINPGNSGGPLVNMQGEVVGINTAIASKTGGYMGIGFAIPIDMAKSIMDSLIDRGKVDRGWMGVMIQDLNEDLAKSFAFNGTDGVLVGDVVPNGPAAKVGIKAGDIIVKFNESKVNNVTDLRNKVAGTTPNKTVTIELFRQGQKRTVEMKVGQLEGAAVSSTGEGKQNNLGLTVQTLTPETARKLGVNVEKGVMVISVETGQPAHRAGLQVNEIIVSVNGTEISDATAFLKEAGKHSLKTGIRLRVVSKEGSRFVFLKSHS